MTVWILADWQTGQLISIYMSAEDCFNDDRIRLINHPKSFIAPDGTIVFRIQVDDEEYVVYPRYAHPDSVWAGER